MCGINGYVGDDRKLVQQMNEAIAHRGPDASAVWSDGAVTLGHRRLAIIDLSAAAEQPMHYKQTNDQLVIVFNGEIYNFQDIKDELVKLGYSFKTKSDTEVILASYLAWGPDCVKRFNGMWAFALYDTKKKILFCSRDRAGKKPFYFSEHNGEFIFSSELKGILADKKRKLNRKENIDHDALQLYLSLGYIPSPYTIFKKTSKLEPRENLLYDINNKKIIKRWFYYELPDAKAVHDKKALLEEGRELLKDSVRLRMIADVPVGAFLSGGLDSSTIVGEMANFVKLEKLHTFSIGFEGAYDETKYVNIVKDAFHTQHHHKYFTKEDFERLIPEFPKIYDEPFAEYSGFPVTVVSKLARKYVTVSLSGDGGDEVFGGYPTHKSGHQMDLIRKIPRPLRKLGSKLPIKKNLDGMSSAYMLKEAFKLSLEKPESFYAKALPEDTYRPTIYQTLTEKRLAYCIEKSDGSFGEALRLYDLLYHTLGDHYLAKVDRASMSTSLEVRCPFLDYRLLEFSQKLPGNWKADTMRMKKFMRELIKDIVPKEILNRGKKGFTPPIDIWILEEKHKPVLVRGLGTLQKLDKDAAVFYERVVYGSSKLFTLYKIRLFLFQLWWERWME